MEQAALRQQGVFTSMVRRVELVIRKKTVDSTTGTIYARSANTKLRKHRPQHNEGVVTIRTGIKRVEHASHAGICETGPLPVT